MIKSEINGLKEIESFMIALADNLARVVKEELAAGSQRSDLRAGGPGKSYSEGIHLRKSRSMTAPLHRGSRSAEMSKLKRTVRRNFLVSKMDSRKRGDV